ncbi:4,4'-diaponeurosporen-aldehyde dehydrogenase [Colletotrichum fructicola]|uniref:Aldehyde dehydrogenase, putative n=1 Tax=Colletotrichum fructicola (strain Nara gc5) TaxID=1213859 RepID=L2FN72_COLFN|nr:4,4'-diaponeurosporen-aldehyde dehydrogenase [Colletotrichum fructicola]KAF4900935.1 4,4'-diaponeurosporen-aldehyde dehydrogenase [Colletotrichum fructicola]
MANHRNNDLDQIVLDRVTAAAIDRRAHNIRYRQQQLQQLHSFLRKHVDTICKLTMQDSNYTDEEAGVEFSLTANAVKTLYDQLDFDECLKKEYAISRNQSNIGARTPIGIVLIRPGSHSRFFSIISPLAAALASGNCVILELPPSLRELDSFLRSELTILDHDAFVIVSSAVTDTDTLSRCCIVDQLTTTPHVGTTLSSKSESMTVVIVDRTAKMEDAVDAVCTARFSFGGQSPYAPDLVLVNEWVRDEFVTLCVQRLSAEAARSKSETSSGRAVRQDIPMNGTAPVDVLFDTRGIKLVELPRNTTSTDCSKVSERTLRIMTVSSLTDAVTVASNNGPYLAVYAFGSKGVFGPARPVSAASPSSIELRYETQMMTRTRPEFVCSLTGEKFEDIALARSANDTPSGLRKENAYRSLREDALRSLRPIGQGSGSSIGFFDQGIITGMLAFALPALAMLGYGGFKTVLFCWKLYESKM